MYFLFMLICNTVLQLFAFRETGEREKEAEVRERRCGVCVYMWKMVGAQRIRDGCACYVFLRFPVVALNRGSSALQGIFLGI